MYIIDIMHIAYHHVLKRHKHTKEKKSPFGHRIALENIMDKLVYVSALFGVFANIPQLATIWIDKNVAGVSVVTWLGFLVGSFFWLCYGIVHREKPIMITNGLYVAIQFFIVFGLVLQKVPFFFY